MNTQKTLEALLQTIERLKAQLDGSPKNTTATNESGFLKFTEKEISKMPKEFRKTFRLHGCTVHVRKRCTGRYNCSYEIRYARDGYNISVSATTLEVVKQRFVEKVSTVTLSCNSSFRTPTNFNDFAMYWFENFHKRKVGAKTYDHDIKVYLRHICPAFGSYAVSRISPYQLQTFLDGFDDRPKTRAELRSTFNQVFNSAVNHGILKLNPIGMVFTASYEKKHGQALTKDEERLLLENAEKRHRLYFAIALYTGLRPNEFSTAVVDGAFIKAVNSKRKNKKLTYKRIPITPMLRQYLTNDEPLQFPSSKVLTKEYKKLLPSHRLYDLRTTFQTRCSECGIPDNVIGVFMGNSIGKLKDVYTDYSDEYLIKEGNKLMYK